MPVQHHRKSAGCGPNLSEPVFDIVVVLRPAIDVGAVTTRPTEATLVIGHRCDPCPGELRCDVPVTARVLRDAVDEEQMRTWCAPGRPEVGAQVEAVACAHDAAEVVFHS